jgi:hypothetical protein
MGHECCIRTGKKKKRNNNNRRRNLCREETITAAASNRIVTIMRRGEARSPWSKQTRGRRRRGRRRGGGTIMDQLDHPWSTTTSTPLSGNAAFCEESAASLWLSLVLFCTTSTATV